MRLFSTILLAIFVSGTISPVFGWHDEGHKLTGYIAWQRMTPQTRAEAIGKLDDFPDELKEFEVEERRHLEAAIKQIEEHLREADEATHANRT